jgi:chromosome segregation ATPase
MKAMAFSIVLLVLCVVLAGLLYVQQKRNVQQQTATVTKVVTLSNELTKASSSLLEEKNEKETLQTNLLEQAQQIQSISNELVSVTEKLAKVEVEAKTAAQAAQAAQEEVAKRDNKILELEGQREDLTKRMGDLTNSISGLEQMIAATEKKLQASEGDRTFLLRELKRLQSEKAELEKQLNSLAFLRDQVRKLREELSVQRKLDWIRRGILVGESVKGAERLQQMSRNQAAIAQSNYNLNVELRQDGSVKVAPTGTNAPPVQSLSTNK